MVTITDLERVNQAIQEIVGKGGFGKVEVVIQNGAIVMIHKIEDILVRKTQGNKT